MNSYRIPEIANKYTEHDMIRKYTDLPHIAEFRTRLLHAFLNKQSSLSDYSELYTLVTSLVQLGLDTHDMVSITNDSKEQKATRSRQLKVLAGDYFSSRFYHLLSKAGHIDLVSVLSGAICETNRLKTVMYLKMKQLKLTADEYIRQSVEVKTQLFTSFAALLEDRLKAVWPETLCLFTRCEVLLEEIIRSETPQDYKDSWGFWHVMQWGTKEEKKLLNNDEPDHSKIRPIWLKYKITVQLYERLDDCMKELQEKLQGLEADNLGKELLTIGEPFRMYLSTPRATQEV